MATILRYKNEILSLADRAIPGLVQRGGGQGSWLVDASNPICPSNPHYVVLRIAAANFALVALSLLATTWPLISLGLAVVVVVVLLVWLMRHPDTASNAASDPTAVQT